MKHLQQSVIYKSTTKLISNSYHCLFYFLFHTLELLKNRIVKSISRELCVGEFHFILGFSTTLLILGLLFNCNPKSNNSKTSNMISLATLLNLNTSSNFQPIPLDYTFLETLDRQESCDSLEKKYKEELRKYYTHKYNEAIYIAERYNDGYAMPVTTTATSATTSTGTQTNTNREFSTTNTQEAGVDEGDLIKTNGYYIYYALSDTVKIINISNTSNPTIINSIRFNSEYISELYLFSNSGKNFLIVRTTAYSYSYTTISLGSGDASNKSKIYIYDVSNPLSTSLQGTYEFDSSVSATRITGNNLYIIHNFPFYLKDESSAWTYYNSNSYYSFNKNKFLEAAKTAYLSNLEKVNQISIVDIIPTYTYKNSSNVGELKDISSCNSIYFPYSGNGLGRGIVSVLDLTKTENSLKSTGIITNWDIVYMSPLSLYITSTNNWLWITPVSSQSVSNPEQKTGIHKFSLGTEEITYKGSGKIDGWVNNNFSMSEYDSKLRIGTTKGGIWDTQNMSNELNILSESNSKLQVIGKIQNIAKGERIYSMRFDKTKG